MSPVIRASKEEVAYNLMTYGEDTLLPALAAATPDQLTQIQRRAGYYAFGTASKSGYGMMFARALALAAVEVLEGSPRELRRQRRKKVQA
jgi:hypothetical protein